MRDALEALARGWEQRKAWICSLPPAQAQLPPAGGPGAPRRRQNALKVAPREAREAFGLDRLWRPTARTGNRFTAPAGGTVTDRATGLTWQTDGCAYPITWPRAFQYVGQLNAARFGGHGDWRLPTVDELASLLRQAPRGQAHCLEPVFHPARNRLWASDRKSFTEAWYVDADLGFVHWQDFGCPNYVQAVRSAPP